MNYNMMSSQQGGGNFQNVSHPISSSTTPSLQSHSQNELMVDYKYCNPASAAADVQVHQSDVPSFTEPQQQEQQIEKKRPPSPGTTTAWLQEAFPDSDAEDSPQGSSSLRRTFSDSSFVSLEEEKNNTTSAMASSHPSEEWSNFTFAEPDPLLVDYPKRADSNVDMSLSNIENPDPLLKVFAQICHSTGPLDEFT